MAFASTVYSNPEMLILDEPTASLGVNESMAILDIMRSLRQQGLSQIFISHNLEEVFSVSDRIIVLRRGKIIAEDVTENFSTEEVTHLMLAGSKVD